MSIVFVIDEVGTFAYLEPLFLHWLDGDRSGWHIIVGDDISHFARYKSIKSKLPHISKDDAMQRQYAFVTSLGSSSERLDSLFTSIQSRKLQHIGIIDTWDKIWHSPPHIPTQLFVIDADQANKIQNTHPAITIHIIGQPAWEMAPPLPEAPPNSILFIGQPIKKHYQHHLGYDEDTAWRLLSSVINTTKHTLSYALHPAQKDDDIRPVVGKNTLILTDLSLALAENETIISPFSSALFDAWLGGYRRVISLQPNVHEQNDKCYLSRNSIIGFANTKTQLTKHLTAPILEPLLNPFIGSLEQLKKALDPLREK